MDVTLTQLPTTNSLPTTDGELSGSCRLETDGLRPIVCTDGTQTFRGQRYWPMPPNGYFRRRGKFLHREVFRMNGQEIPKGWHIHHRDGNTADNAPENLEAVSPKTHAKVHWTTERAERSRQHLCSVRHKAAKWHSSPAGHALHSANGKKVMALRPLLDKTCEWCLNPFRSKVKRARFCHLNHKMLFYRREGRIP